jgi:hypothetical protein
MTKTCTMLSLVVLALTLTAAAQMDNPRVRAIYESAASIPTNVEGIHMFPEPPVGFKPLTASDEELAAYGFPPRPDKTEDPHGYEVWARVMSIPAKRWYGELKPSKAHSTLANRALSRPPAQVLESSATPANEPNWSGVLNTISGTTFSTKTSFCCVAAEFVVPQPQQAFNGSGGNICDGNTDQASFWVGQGGAPGPLLGNQNNIAQTGVDILATCNNSDGGAYAWMEWFPAASQQLFNVSAGDDIYVSVNVTSSTSGLFNIIDETSQIGQAFHISAPVSDSCGGQCELVGNEAEYIVERPAVGCNTCYTPLANYIWSLWDFARSKTFSKVYHYPGSSSSSTFVISMTDDAGDQIISAPTVGTAGTLGLEGMFVQDEHCARVGGCTP